MWALGMMGVSLTSWRVGIGLFYARTGLRNTAPCESDDNMIHYIQLIIGYIISTIMRSLLFQLLYGLTLVFTYSVIIVTLFPLLTMIYFFLDMSVWAFVSTLRQGQRCSRISLYVSIFVGVTLM